METAGELRQEAADLRQEEEHCLAALDSVIPQLTDGEDTLRLKEKPPSLHNGREAISKQGDSFSVKTDDDEGGVLGKGSPYTAEVPGPLRWCSDLHLREEFTFDSPSPTPSTRERGTMRSAFSLSLTSMSKQSSVANQMKKLISKREIEDKSAGPAVQTNIGEKFLVQVREANMEAIRKTLDQNPEVINFSNPYGVTGLMMAIEKENNDLARFLIERDADVNAMSKNFQKETSLSRAAKMQNKAIVSLLVEKGAEIQVALNCICNPQIGNDWVNDEKAFSLTGVKLLVSPQILAATKEPILTAFSASNKLYMLAKRREEYRDIYSDLAKECEVFAYSFLDQCENLWEARRLLSKEMKIIDKAISGSKKEFVAHPFVQSLLKEQNFGKFMNNSFWGCAVLLLKWWCSVVLFPYYGILYLNMGKHRKLKYSYLGEYIEFMKTPLLCLIADTIAYFLCLTMLICICVIDELSLRYNHLYNGFEYVLWACIVGQTYTEAIQVQKLGWKKYFAHFWNLLDLTIILITLVAIGFRMYSIVLYSRDPNLKDELAYYQAISGLLYGVLCFVQTIKILNITDASYILGPLQLAMKSMMRDLMLIFILLTTVIISFSLAIFVTMQQITRFYPNNDEIPPYFISFEQTLATLFWAIFGFIDFVADLRELEQERETVFILFYILFAGYLLMSTILLLNMLIAMLTTTFERIQHQSDVEWKFARSVMYRGYTGGQSYPAPFNLICHALIVLFSYFFRCSRKPLIGETRGNNAQDQYREKLIQDLRKRLKNRFRKKKDKRTCLLYSS